MTHAAIAGARRLALARNLILGVSLVGGGALVRPAIDEAVAPTDCTPSATVICVAPGALPGWAYVGEPSPSASTAPSESVGPTASPSQSSAPTPTPSLAPSPSPSASAAPPSPTPIACGTSLQSLIDAAPGASVLDLGACTYTAGATVNKPLTIRRGTIIQSGTALLVTANDVTIDGTAFDGGNRTVQVSGDRSRILGATFVRMRETSIDFVPGADDALVDGVTITQTILTSHGYSPMSANDGGAGVGTFKRMTIRNSTVDQGPGGVAWFGVEVWGVQTLLIEGNTFRGGGVPVSIPRSDGAIVRANNFDLSQNGWVGVELADIENVQVLDNIVTGTVQPDSTWRAFLQLHPGSGAVRNITITGNRVTNHPALLNAAGSGHTIRDNCLNGVARLQWGSFSGPNLVVANNGPCS